MIKKKIYTIYFTKSVFERNSFVTIIAKSKEEALYLADEYIFGKITEIYEDELDCSKIISFYLNKE